MNRYWPSVVSRIHGGTATSEVGSMASLLEAFEVGVADGWSSWLEDRCKTVVAPFRQFVVVGVMDIAAMLLLKASILVIADSLSVS
jgi:hypothetical protein